MSNDTTHIKDNILYIVVLLLILACISVFAAETKFDECTWTTCTKQKGQAKFCVTKSGSLIELVEAFAEIDETKVNFAYSCKGDAKR